MVDCDYSTACRASDELDRQRQWHVQALLGIRVYRRYLYVSRSHFSSSKELHEPRSAG